MTYYRSRGMGEYLRMGFGFAVGWLILRVVLGTIVLATIGVWTATGRINPAARWIVRGLLIVAGLAVILAVLSDI